MSKFEWTPDYSVRQASFVLYEIGGSRFGLGIVTRDEDYMWTAVTFTSKFGKLKHLGFYASKEIAQSAVEGSLGVTTLSSKAAQISVPTS